MLSRGQPTLKASDLSLWQVLTPRLPGLPLGELLRERGCEKPSAPEHHTMNAHTPVLPDRAAAHALEHARLAALRGAISRQIQADLDRVDRCLAILDALTPDPDIEADNILHHAHPYGSGLIGVGSDDEPSLCGSEGSGSMPLWPSDNSLAFLDRERDEADLELAATEWAGRGVHRFSVGVAA